MSMWLIWILIAVFFAVAEILTLSFFMAPFCAGALVAALAAALGVGDALTVAIFLVITLLTFMLIRPIAKAHRRVPESVRTGTDALLGQQALVVEPIVNDEGNGLIRMQSGEVWTARALNPDETFQIGEHVTVDRFRGVSAFVSRTTE